MVTKSHKRMTIFLADGSSVLSGLKMLASSLFVFCFCFLVGLRLATATEECQVLIITDQAKYITEDEFLSFTLDPFLLHDVTPRWGTLDFNSSRVQTLARGLSPAIIRYGGTDADWQIFNLENRTTANGSLLFVPKRKLFPEKMRKIQDSEPKVVLYPQDVDNLRNLAVQAGGKLLFDLNIQLRYGSQWDPLNAMELFHYIKDKGYTDDFDFQLGNEPKYPELSIDGKRIAEDFNILCKVLDSMDFTASRVVGPDLDPSASASKTWPDIIRDFVPRVDKCLTAVTIHHYYFHGPGAVVSEYLDLHHFESLAPLLLAIRGAVTAAGGASIDIWLDETSDALGKGTPNISDRFASGFLWLDKLGVAASQGIKIVARQIFYGGNYPLLSPALEPNPDYWLSFVFKRLVGRGVLDTELFTSMTALGYARAYAHCTSPRAKYPDGSVTLYAINILQNSSITLFLDQSLGAKTVDLYLLSPDGSEGLLSPYVAVNGKRLALIDDHTLPTLSPVSQPAEKGIVLPPLTFGFFVLPDVNAPACTDVVTSEANK